MLIKETKGRGIEFVYAISPGLDITFSDDKDVQALRRKLEQVTAAIIMICTCVYFVHVHVCNIYILGYGSWLSFICCSI